MAVVYRHRRLDNNEIFYIGIGLEIKRAYNKVTRNSFWKNIINKTKYQVEIIANNLDYEDAKELEILLIKEYGRRDLGLGNLVNLTDGGDGTIGYKHTKEAKLKHSIAGKKTHLNKNQTGYNNHMYGLIGELHHRYNTKHTIESRNKMSESHKGKTLTEKHCKNVSLNHSKHRSKKVICTITNIIYNSVVECAKINNLNRRTLTGKLNGSRFNNTTFKFLEDGCN